MKLYDAVKSGRPFKRNGCVLFKVFDSVHMLSFSREDILADDYELIPDEVTVSREKAIELFDEFQSGGEYYTTRKNKFLSDLGFK
jgi:hypothetical protein